MLAYATLLLAALPLAVGQRCNADNCYRAVKRYQSTSTAFCGQYLDHATAAPSPIATYGPTRLSSACSCLATATPAPGNLLVNGGFETGSADPWTIVTRGGYVTVTDSSESTPNFPFRARSGRKFAQIGTQGDGEQQSLSQSVALTAGQTYAFTAYYSVLDLPLSTCFLRGTIGGVSVAEASIFSGAGGGNPPGYYQLTGNYVAPATATETLLVELWCDFSSLGGVFGLDDVSLV